MEEFQGAGSTVLPVPTDLDLAEYSEVMPGVDFSASCLKEAGFDKIQPWQSCLQAS